MLQTAKGMINNGSSIRVAAKELKLHESTLRKGLKAGYGNIQIYFLRRKAVKTYTALQRSDQSFLHLKL